MFGFTLPTGVIGEHEFAEGRKYRLSLTRYIKGCEDAPYMLWCGLNPSSADKDNDDPTCRKEFKITQEAGYNRYIKVNCADIVSTKPSGILGLGIPPWSPQNFKRIEELANDEACASIVVAFGSPQIKELRFALAKASAILSKAAKSRGQPLLCLGVNKDGAPAHPLYLANATALRPWKRILF